MTVNPAPRRRGRPARVSRGQILAAALAIVDANGLEQLTMRRLGAELGVDPMTIYGHVPDKAALFDGLVELVLTEIEVPAAAGLGRTTSVPSPTRPGPPGWPIRTSSRCSAPGPR